MIYTGFSQVSIYLHFSIFCWGYLVAGSGLGLGQLARAIRMARAVRCGPEIRFIKMICRKLRRMIRMLRHLRQTFSSASENQTWYPSAQRYDSCKDSWRTKLYRVKALTVGRGRVFFADGRTLRTLQRYFHGRAKKRACRRSMEMYGIYDSVTSITTWVSKLDMKSVLMAAAFLEIFLRWFTHIQNVGQVPSSVFEYRLLRLLRMQEVLANLTASRLSLAAGFPLTLHTPDILLYIYILNYINIYI